MNALSYDSRGLTSSHLAPASRLDAADESRMVPRLAQALGAVLMRWKNEELGFMSCPDADAHHIVRWAQEQRTQGWTDQVVIGIGGSSLGTRAVLDAARPHEREGLRTHWMENVDPHTIHALLASLPLATTLFLVVTKSGTTIETMGNFALAWHKVVEAVGAERAPAHFVAITDPREGALRKLALELGLVTFEVPPNVGGRFSVLTAVGLVPLALAGYPVERLLDGARAVRDGLLPPAPAPSHPVMLATAHHFLLLERGFDQLVMMAYADALQSMVEWFRQLWAESLGKATDRQGRAVHTGITPTRAWGAIDQHSQVQLYMEGPNDKHICFVGVRHWDHDPVIPQGPALPPALAHLAQKTLSDVLGAELDGTQAALTEAGRPTSRWTLERVGPEALGEFLFTWEMATALMGELLDIDAFDQPGVELGKKIAHGLLGRSDLDAYASLARKHLREPTGSSRT